MSLQQRQLFRDYFIKFCKDRDEELDDRMDAMFEYYHQLKAKEQERLFQDFAKQHKVNPKITRQYFFGDFAREFLYQLTEEDKSQIRQICLDMRGQGFSAIFGQVMSVLHGEQNKKVHIETVKQSVRYYIKKSNEKDAGK